MAKRPRGTCRVCGRGWRARWQGDTLIVLSHLQAGVANRGESDAGSGSGSDVECPGSGLPDVAEPLPAPRQSSEPMTSWATAS